MGQQICLNKENPMKDIEELNNLAYSMMNYGMVHEEVLDLIAETMTVWTCNQGIGLDELETEYKEDGDYDTLAEYICSNYGYNHFSDIIESSYEIKAQEEAASKFRDIIMNAIYADSYQSPEEILSEIE